MADDCRVTCSSRRSFITHMSGAMLAALVGVEAVSAEERYPVIDIIGVEVAPSQKSYPLPAADGVNIDKSAQAVLALWQRNVFPDMKIEWGTYIENIGHTNFPGCFRCHDESHETKEGQKIAQDCNSCHSLLAVDEKSPQALETLGVSLTP